jgi:hypothetical protein
VTTALRPENRIETIYFPFLEPQSLKASHPPEAQLRSSCCRLSLDVLPMPRARRFQYGVSDEIGLQRILEGRRRGLAIGEPR